MIFDGHTTSKMPALKRSLDDLELLLPRKTRSRRVPITVVQMNREPRAEIPVHENTALFEDLSNTLPFISYKPPEPEDDMNKENLDPSRKRRSVEVPSSARNQSLAPLEEHVLTISMIEDDDLHCSLAGALSMFRGGHQGLELSALYSPMIQSLADTHCTYLICYQ